MYVTPAHQYPTGGTLSPARRTELVAWARRNGCYILEDDYDSEFQYDGSPLQALAAWRLIARSTSARSRRRWARDCVWIHRRSAAADRRGARRENAAQQRQCLARPGRARRVRARRRLQCAHHALSRAIQGSRDALLRELRRHFGNVEIGGEAAGLHVFWQLPAGVPRGLAARGTRAPQSRRRVFAGVGRCARTLSDDARAAQPPARLCRHAAGPDRARHSTAVRRGGRHTRQLP